MKVYIFYRFILSLLVVLFYSCESYETTVNELQEQGNLKKTNSINAKISYTCVGTCECGMIRYFRTNIMECTCDPCSLQMTVSSLTVNAELSEEEKSIFLDKVSESEILMVSYDYVEEYIKENYSIENPIFKLIELTYSDDNGMFFVKYYFSDNNGVQQTVSFVENLRVLNGDITYIIDCKGNTCDCQEQYNMGNGTVSCKCNDCVMDIKVIKKVE